MVSQNVWLKMYWLAQKKFEKEKANYLHVVDLNGAKEGSRVNADLICEVVKTCQLPVEVGGGIRTMEAIDFILKMVYPE